MTEKEIKIIELQVNGSQAKQQLDELRKHVAALEEKKAKAQDTIANIFATDEMKRQATAELKAINKELKVKEQELKANVNRMKALETVCIVWTRRLQNNCATRSRKSTRR